MNISAEGWPTIICTGALASFGWAFWPPSALLCIPLVLLALWFYRDPERSPLCGVNGWVSPADGKVVEIDPVDHPYTGPAVKVGIFMNPLSVHVNRIPRKGVVEFLEYVPGKKWMACAPKASEVNERFYLGLSTDVGRMLVVQIAGLLARRIVCRSRRGQAYATGERFGMIKLGSKVDVYLPQDVELQVTVGQKVYAGRTCIGVCYHETTNSIKGA